MVGNNLRTNEQLIPYLTDEAWDLIKHLHKTYGVDRDLAMGLIHLMWPEEWIYELPEKPRSEEE